MSLSSAQKTLLRSESQYSILGLAILNPKTILAAQITDYTGTDMVTEFEFGSVSAGSYADVLPGHIVFLGSVAGAHDIGIVRARKAWTSDTAYIGETSDISFANDIHITVVDAFDVRPRHLVVSADEVLMDVDVAYSDQHENFDPIVRMGGQVVVDVESYPVVVSFPTVADSSVYDSTISAYLLAASEGVVSDETTDTPSVTISSYPTNGYIRVSETITAANGKSFTGYRYILVFDVDHRPITDFVIDDLAVDRESGGWSVNVVLNEEADIDLVRVGGLAVLFSKDFFDGEEGVIGLYAGRENVLMSGWVWSYASLNDPEFQPRSFEIQSAAFWLSRMSSFPVGVELNPDVADAWTNMQNLTVDRGLFHFLHWRTTVTQVMDVYLTGDTRYSPATESSAVNIWDQVYDIAQSQILAQPACNHNGMLSVQIPYNLIPSADRAASSALVMALTAENHDYVRQVEIQRQPPEVAQVVLNGITADEYGNGVSLFSLSPGHVPALLGDLLPMPNLLLEDQTQANQLAGLVFADENNPYPSIPLVLTGNNRAFDIAPILYGTIAGLDEYSGTIIPESISISFESGDQGNSGKLVVEVEFKGETTEADAIYIDGDIPDGDGGFVSIGGLGKLPPIKPLDLPEIPPTTFPPTISTVVDTDCGSLYKNFFPLVWSKPFLDGADSDKLVASANFPCKIRSSPLAQTYIDFQASVHSDAASYITVYGVLGGTRIVTASLAAGIGFYAFRAYFNVLSDTVVDGFEIELDAGIGPNSGIWYVEVGSVITSGSVNANIEAGVDLAVTAGERYAIDGSGGPWKPGPFFANNYYMFALDASGAIGNSDGTFLLALPSIGVFASQISTNHGRCYFVADDSDINFRIADNAGQFGDNTGSLGYTLKNALIYGRAVELHRTVLNNVCAPA